MVITLILLKNIFKILLDTIYRKVIYYGYDITTADISADDKLG